MAGRQLRSEIVGSVSTKSVHTTLRWNIFVIVRRTWPLASAGLSCPVGPCLKLSPLALPWMCCCQHWDCNQERTLWGTNTVVGGFKKWPRNLISSWCNIAFLSGEFAFAALVVSAVLTSSEGRKGLRTGKDRWVLWCFLLCKMCQQTALRYRDRHSLPLPLTISHSCKIMRIYWSMDGLPPVQNENRGFLLLLPPLVAVMCEGCIWVCVCACSFSSNSRAGWERRDGAH